MKVKECVGLLGSALRRKNSSEEGVRAAVVQLRRSFKHTPKHTGWFEQCSQSPGLLHTPTDTQSWVDCLCWKLISTGHYLPLTNLKQKGGSFLVETSQQWGHSTVLGSNRRLPQDKLLLCQTSNKNLPSTGGMKKRGKEERQKLEMAGSLTPALEQASKPAKLCEWRGSFRIGFSSGRKNIQSAFQICWDGSII